MKRTFALTELIIVLLIWGILVFTKEPINPYTGKSMLSNNSADSGLQYQSTGDKYKLCVVQNDIDDINNNGRIDDPLPVTSYPACTSTPSS